MEERQERREEGSRGKEKKGEEMQAEGDRRETKRFLVKEGEGVEKWREADG